jgi:hypothetical protein
MSNSTIDVETIDYTEGEDCMKALYNERNCVSKTWDDFLKLPKSDGYLNNVKRVPNSFSKVTDKKDDPYTTIAPIPKVEEHNPIYIYR